MTTDDIQTTNKEELIFDVTETDFAEKVIEKSEEKIILVDFWAPWCGPCKQLTPVLEEIIKEASGTVLLAKINIDENQQLAAQLRIQSIPTVIAFNKKQIANGFQGVIPKPKIIEFIEKISGKAFPINKEKIYEEIKYLMENNNFDEAINKIEDFLSEDSNDAKVISLYIECLSDLKNFEEVSDFINSLSNEIKSNSDIQKAIEKFKMLEKISKEPSVDLLLSNYNDNPNNIENLFKLCDKYFFEQKHENAFELLLENYIKLKEKDKKIIKEKLLKYFDVLGNSHEQTKTYRRKLSSVYFK